MENEILNEEEMNVLTLTDEDGESTDFLLLSVIEYEGGDYMVLLPLMEAEDEDEEE